MVRKQQKIIECVPNISEGRETSIIDEVAAAAADSGAEILHIDSGYDANRTVLTVAGTPEEIEEAAFQICAAAALLIDMRIHTGRHPRIGALDVCPFIPLRGAGIDDCRAIARRVGRRIGAELGLPVFLYGEAAESEQRRSLADVRRGQYEGLAERMKDPAWRPDFGPAAFVPRFGAAAVGARGVLVAYNVSLSGNDLAAAKKIAAAVRRLHPSLKAIGWHMPEYDCVQVSMNLLDYRVCGLFEAYQACVQEAERFSVQVAGSELIGMLPYEALAAAGRQLLGGEHSEPELTAAAVKGLCLDLHAPFDLQERVLEYRLMPCAI